MCEVKVKGNILLLLFSEGKLLYATFRLWGKS